VFAYRRPVGRHRRARVVLDPKASRLAGPGVGAFQKPGVDIVAAAGPARRLVNLPLSIVKILVLATGPVRPAGFRKMVFPASPRGEIHSAGSARYAGNTMEGTVTARFNFPSG